MHLSRSKQACRLYSFQRISSIQNPSAAGTKSTIGSCSGPTTNYIGSFEDCSDMPADIFGDLDTELDIDKLEEFAQSLLEDITADMEVSSSEKQTTTCNNKQDNTRKMVGPSSKQLESRGSERLKTIIKSNLQDSNSDQRRKKPIQKRPQIFEVKQEIKNTESTPKTEELIYETLNDECITIIVTDDSSIPISEVVTEVVTSEIEAKNLADYVSSYTVHDDEMMEDSVISNDALLKPEKALSDCGYESLGSPHSESSDVEISELWNQSFTELFPNLI